MAAVQRMRGRAQSNGRLSSNPQQTVTNETQNGQSAVEIEPANPDYIDVPEYNPQYVWGPPAGGYYPPLWYPPVDSTRLPAGTIHRSGIRRLNTALGLTRAFTW